MNYKFSLLLIIHLFTLCSIYAIYPYAVDKIQNSADDDLYDFIYDNAGNRLHEKINSQRIFYGLIGKPETIITGSDTEIFQYGTGGKRILRISYNGDKTFYIGDVHYRLLQNEEVQSIVYIKHGAYSSVAEVDTTNLSELDYRYFLPDHQGTSLVAVNDLGTVQGRKRYDSWGLPVTASGNKVPTKNIDDKFPGFTGHEMIKSAGLIHANGRVYDPIGMFISPDPVLLRNRLVSLNRYAYVLNNPNNHVDVNGYSPERISALLKNDRVLHWFRNLPENYRALPFGGSEMHDINTNRIFDNQVKPRLQQHYERLNEGRLPYPTYHLVNDRVVPWELVKQQIREGVITKSGEQLARDYMHSANNHRLNDEVADDIIAHATPEVIGMAHDAVLATEHMSDEEIGYLLSNPGLYDALLDEPSESSLSATNSDHTSNSGSGSFSDIDSSDLGPNLDGHLPNEMSDFEEDL